MEQGLGLGLWEGDRVDADAERLHRQASRLGAEWLSAPFADFWSKLGNELATRSIVASGYSTHQADMEAIRSLIAQESAWGMRLRSGLEGAALAWRSRQVAPLRARTLSLMSEIELSSHLYAQQLAAELQRILTGPLEESDRRVAAMAASLGLRSGVGNPWAPEAFLRVFAETLPLDEFTATLVPITFDQLGRSLPALMRDVLPRLSTLLEGGGVVAFPAASATPAAPMRREAPVEAKTPGHDTATMAEDTESGIVGQDTVANLRGRPALDPVPPGPATEPVQRRDNGMPRYRDIVHDHLAQWRERAQASGTWTQPKAAGQGAHVLRSAEVMTMASVLQGEDPAPFATALARRGGSSLQVVIREEMLKAAAQLGFDREQTHFGQDDEDAIDLVAILFDTLAEGNDLMPRGTRMFGKLVLPYVKVAMLDDSLFNRRSHPARRLLDALAETCDGNAGESATNREMLDRAEAVVDQVVDRFQEDQAIIELAAQELREHLEQQQLRAEIAERRMAEALHGRERLHFARQAAHEDLGGLLASGPLSQASQHFLEQFWQKALTHTWLRYGAESTRYRAMVVLGNRLAKLDEAGAALQADKLASGFIAEIDALRECLSLCGRIGEAADEALARLCSGLADADAERAIRHAQPLPEDDRTDLPTSGLHLASTRDKPCDPVLVARLRKLRVGQGLRIREEEGRESAAKIAWISPLTARFLIVNRRGMRKLVVSPEELADMVERGEVTIRAIEAPVDQAMRQVWEQLRAAGRQVH